MIVGRAPPVFGRATITLGICPHSSFIDIMSYLTVIRSHDRKVAINYYY